MSRKKTHSRHISDFGFLESVRRLCSCHAMPLINNLSAVFLSPVINYCSFGNHSCQHECLSVLNGYFCRCNEGYTLQEDGKTCLRKYKLLGQVQIPPHICHWCMTSRVLHILVLLSPNGMDYFIGLSQVSPIRSRRQSKCFEPSSLFAKSSSKNLHSA